MNKAGPVALSFAVASAMACGIAQTETAQPAKVKTYTDTKRAIQFDYPVDWVVEELSSQNVLLVSSPVEEADWQANVFFDLMTDKNPPAPLERRLALLAKNMAKKKKGFELRSSRVISHPSGLSAGELVYTHTSEGVPLTEKELVLRLGDGRALFATGSAVTALWSKYEPQLDVMFQSLRPLREPAPAR